jgi:hypothetical protein
MSYDTLLELRCPSRITAVFDDAARARQTAESLKREAGLAVSQVSLVNPSDPALPASPGRRLCALLTSPPALHLAAVLAGAGGGLAVAGLLERAVGMSTPLHPGMLPVSLAVFGGMCGLLLAGLKTARSSRRSLPGLARAAAHGGDWLVIVQIADRRQRRQVRRILRQGVSASAA